MNNAFLRGIRHGIPIALGYLSVSFTFGMKAVGDGMTPLQALLISATNLTSAGQFAALPLMTGGASLIEMALTQLVINLRYALMSLSLGQRLDGTMNTLSRLLFSFANTDEIFAVASSQPEKVGRKYLFGLILTPYFGWTAGTLLGAVAGTLLPEFFRSALGIAIYGMFLAIILPPAKREKPVRLVVLLAVALSLCLRYVPLFSGISSGFAVILCAVIASAVGALLHPVKEGACPMSAEAFYPYLLVMAGVTYLIRMLPLTVFRREIRSPFLRSFLYYVPYAVLGAMTVPDIFYATGSLWTALAGLVVAVVLAWKEKSLLTVAIFACAAVAVAQVALALVG